jgi:MoaA/NifB/PqqE/SkfB family radical SAM enzyme
MSVSASVDGLAPTHDALRHLAGSHDAALSAMRHLAEAGVPVSANTQIGRRNRRELSGIFDTIAVAERLRKLLAETAELLLEERA